MQIRTAHGLLLAGLVLGTSMLVWRGRDAGTLPPDEGPRAVPTRTLIPEPRKVQSSIPSPTLPPPLFNNFAAEDFPEGWDDLSSDERVQNLEARFTAAVTALEARGSPKTEHIVAAEAALTAMRAELYGSARGRVRHREYEDRLDRALGEPQGVSK